MCVTDYNCKPVCTPKNNCKRGKRRRRSRSCSNNDYGNCCYPCYYFYRSITCKCVVDHLIYTGLIAGTVLSILYLTGQKINMGSSSSNNNNNKDRSHNKDRSRSCSRSNNDNCFRHTRPLVSQADETDTNSIDSSNNLEQVNN